MLANSVTVGSDTRKLLGTLVLLGFGVTGSVAVVLLSLSLLLFGLNWFLSWGWIIVVLTGVLFAGLCGVSVLVVIIWHRPRLEIGPDGFVVRHPFGSVSRRWSDIEGSFVVIKVGLLKGVGYRLTQLYKESAGIKPTKLFAGNDAAITGAFAIPAEELAELLNHHKQSMTSTL